MADLPPGEPATSPDWAEVFAHAAWGIRIGSADGRTVEAVNPAFARMHGYRVDELRRMPVEALYVYSEPGDGTTFKVYLPSIGPSAAKKEQAKPGGGLALPGEVVLLAEDRADVRRLAAQVLRRCGYEVLEAESGDVALALAGNHLGTIHALLTDAVMPGMSGRVLAERLQATRPHTRVIFMSGYTDDAVLERNMAESGIAFIQKPFTPAGLPRRSEARWMRDGRPGMRGRVLTRSVPPRRVSLPSHRATGPRLNHRFPTRRVEIIL